MKPISTMPFTSGPKSKSGSSGLFLYHLAFIICPLLFALTANAATNTTDLESHLLGVLGTPATNRLVAPASPAVTPVPSAAAVSAPGIAITPTATNAVPSSGDIVNLLDDRHKLALGDKLSFRIIEDEEDPKPLIVADSGEVEVPYLGRFPAENKTCRQLAKGIKEALEKDYYFEATVIIAVDLLAKTRGRVYLVGALRIPGPQEILTDETLTLSKAILRSGGFTDFADKKNVKITRKNGPDDKDKQTFIVNVGQIFDNGKVETDLPLEPGDLILVPDRKIRF